MNITKIAIAALTIFLAAPLGYGADQAQPTAATPTPPKKKPIIPRTDPLAAQTPYMRNQKLHETYVALARQGKCGVLFLGDSITQGFHRGQWARLAKYEPLNFGISAERTEHVLARVQQGELEGIKPKVVVMLIGTNNISQCDDKPEWIAAGIKKIIDTVHEKQPQAKVLLLGIFPRDTIGSHKREMVMATNKILATFNNGKNVRYLYFGDQLLGADGNVRPELSKDTVHQTAAGYKIWLDNMLPLLDEMMK